MMNVEVTILAESNERLQKTREELQSEKDEAELKREDLRTQVKAQEDIASKRLQNKLQRDKTQEAKELLAQEEIISQANDDLRTKLSEEKQKLDTLLAGRQEIQEKLKRKQAKMDEDKRVIEEQTAKLTDLSSLISEEQKRYDDQNSELEKAKKLSRFEDEKSRDLQQKNAALSAKLEFIEQGYDYKGNVQGMNLEVFRQIMQTNQNVRKQATLCI